jgi:hypothetical protein
MLTFFTGALSSAAPYAGIALLLVAAKDKIPDIINHVNATREKNSVSGNTEKKADILDDTNKPRDMC